MTNALFGSDGTLHYQTEIPRRDQFHIISSAKSKAQENTFRFIIKHDNCF